MNGSTNNSVTRLRKVAGNARPAMWVVTVCGKDITVLTPCLMNREKFLQQCFEQGVFPALPYGHVWDEELRRLLADGETVSMESLWQRTAR